MKLHWHQHLAEAHIPLIYCQRNFRQFSLIFVIIAQVELIIAQVELRFMMIFYGVSFVRKDTHTGKWSLGSNSLGHATSERVSKTATGTRD